jgi:hypothetical protein
MHICDGQISFTQWQVHLYKDNHPLPCLNTFCVLDAFADSQDPSFWKTVHLSGTMQREQELQIRSKEQVNNKAALT